jgi:hypothetical protein
MSTEPIKRRTLTGFFGGFMLAVQLFVLYRFVGQLEADDALTPWIDRAKLFERMAWLKAGAWQPPWFETYLRIFVASSIWVALALWIGGLLYWWRNRKPGGGE